MAFSEDEVIDWGPKSVWAVVAAAAVVVAVAVATFENVYLGNSKVVAAVVCPLLIK